VEKKINFTEHKADSAHLRSEKQAPDDRKGEYLAQNHDSLASRLKAGERLAATELVDAYYEQIYLFMRRLGHDRHLSEDLTQECFLQAWHHIGQLRSGGALNSWLYRIASNVSKAHWRRGKGREMVGFDAAGLPGSDNEAEYNNNAGHLEQLGRLQVALGKLPRKWQETLVLHYMQGLTIAEAAQAAGIRKGTFKSRLARALEALRKQDI